MKVKTDATWFIWLIPLAAVVFSAWWLNGLYRQKGEHIRIIFESAAGIQIEKTQIRFRGVPIGNVNDLSLSGDHREVVVDAILNKHFNDFAVEGSRFSLVTPNVSLQGVSGLDTIIEGTYIAAQPGTSRTAKVEFKASPSNSLTDTFDDTASYMLESTNVESIGIHDAVTYRGLKVGVVSSLALSHDGRTVRIQISIQNHHLRLVHTKSFFWRKIGVDAKFGLFHSEIKVNSMDSIMNGGVEFATPDDSGPVAKQDQLFLLNQLAPKDVEKWSPKLD